MAEGDSGAYFIGTSNTVLTGSIDPDGTTTVTGDGTAFLSELGEGVDIVVSTETRTITAVASNTSATVSVAFSDNANDTSPEVVSQYATFAAATAAMAATLVGNLTLLHKDEETDNSASAAFTVNTATYLLKITAESGAEHDGTAYGNGARINNSSFDEIKFDAASFNTMDNVEFSNIAINNAGSGNRGVVINDCGQTAALFNRLLIKGDVDSAQGIKTNSSPPNITIRNCIVYEHGESAGEGGLIFATVGGTQNVLVYNNTFIKNYENIVQDDTTTASNFIVKNNLCQGGTNADFRDDGGTFGTTAKNYAQDATSPDSLQETFHDGTSNFVDYDGDNYLMASGGDAIDTLKAGEDLTGTFTDDIIGNTRISSAFFIGASWISVAVGRTTKNTDAYPLGVNVGMSWRMP